MAEFSGTLLFVSHDRYFIDQFADRIWELENGVISDFKGTYRQFRAMKQKQAECQVQEKKEKKQRPAQTIQKNGKNLERQIAKLEKEIEKQEAQISEYDEKIQAAATDYLELAKLMNEKEEAQAELDTLYAEWEERSAMLEE